MSEPIQMMRLVDGLDYSDNQPAGAFTWAFNEHESGQRYIWLRLPGLSNAPIAVLPVVRTDEVPLAGGAHAYWQWDGNEDQPTLTPSILHHSEPPWHGFVTAGKMVTV